MKLRRCRAKVATDKRVKRAAETLCSWKLRPSLKLDRKGRRNKTGSEKQVVECIGVVLGITHPSGSVFLFVSPLLTKQRTFCCFLNDGILLTFYPHQQPNPLP